MSYPPRLIPHCKAIQLSSLRFSISIGIYMSECLFISLIAIFKTFFLKFEYCLILVGTCNFTYKSSNLNLRYPNLIFLSFTLFSPILFYLFSPLFSNFKTLQFSIMHRYSFCITFIVSLFSGLLTITKAMKNGLKIIHFDRNYLKLERILSIIYEIL